MLLLSLNVLLRLFMILMVLSWFPYGSLMSLLHLTVLLLPYGFRLIFKFSFDHRLFVLRVAYLSSKIEGLLKSLLQRALDALEFF